MMNKKNNHLIRIKDGHLKVPDEPIIPYIKGDGIGIDITPVTLNVINSGINQAYNGHRKIQWEKVLAGEEAFKATGLKTEDTS